METKILEFFRFKLINLHETEWKEIFPVILKYIDKPIVIPEKDAIHTDKKFTYVVKNGYLKSTGNLAKKGFCKLLLRKIKFL